MRVHGYALLPLRTDLNIFPADIDPVVTRHLIRSNHVNKWWQRRDLLAFSALRSNVSACRAVALLLSLQIKEAIMLGFCSVVKDQGLSAVPTAERVRL